MNQGKKSFFHREYEESFDIEDLAQPFQLIFLVWSFLCILIIFFGPAIYLILFVIFAFSTGLSVGEETSNWWLVSVLNDPEVLFSLKLVLVSGNIIFMPAYLRMWIGRKEL